MGGTVIAIEQAGQVAEHHLISEKLGRESISASEVVKTAALSAVAAPVMSRAASVIESTVSQAMTKRGTSLTTQESVQGPGASPSKMAEPELKSVAAEASIDVTRARVEANIAASRKGRESSNFEEHVQREATARAASNQPEVASAAPPRVVDKSWKDKIDGIAQRTGNDSAHQIRTYREAIAYAKDPDVVSVHLDHGYNRALGLEPKTIAPNRRPDVVAVYGDGRVARVEVQSKTDFASILRGRNAALDNQLQAQGYTPLTPRVVVPTRRPK